MVEELMMKQIKIKGEVRKGMSTTGIKIGERVSEEIRRTVTYKELRADIDKDFKWTGNILRMYAERLFLYPTKEEEIIRTDMTDKFLKELEREIKHKEIWKIQIKANIS